MIDDVGMTGGALNALVAESVGPFRRRMVSQLEALGLNTFEAGCGREAVEIVASCRVHALVIDTELPDFGGLQAVRVMRTFTRVPPFLLVARKVTRALTARAMESRAVSILQSTSDLGLLAEILEEALVRSYGDFRPQRPI